MFRRFGPPMRLATTAWVIYLGPAVLAVMFYIGAVHNQSIFDFGATIYTPGRDVLAGHSPYPPATLAAIAGHPTFVYPPTILAFDVPLSLLPIDVARIVWALASAGAVAGALRVLNVRDPRCYALALLCVPVIQGLVMGNITVVLVLPLALVWRYRDRALAGGAALGFLIAIKLLLWPLFVWLLATRRIKTAFTAGAVAVAAVVLPWAAIGFKGLADYTQLLHLVGDVTAGPRSLTITTLARLAGLQETAGRGLQWAAGLLMLGLVLRLATQRDGDRRAFSVAVVAALVITPVAWVHYFLFLLVPIALMDRRLAPVWAVPWAFWLIIALPDGDTHYVYDGARNLGAFGTVPSAPKLLLVLSLLAITLVLTASPHRRLGTRAALASAPA
jgi:hypothetical protein